jgi:hypothetical protein
MRDGQYIIALAGNHKQASLNFRLLGLFRQFDKQLVLFRLVDKENPFINACRECLQALDMKWQALKPDTNLSARQQRVDLNERLLLEADQLICLSDSNNIKALERLAASYNIPVFVLRRKKR